MNTSNKFTPVINFEFGFNQKVPCALGINCEFYYPTIDGFEAGPACDSAEEAIAHAKQMLTKNATSSLIALISEDVPYYESWLTKPSVKPCNKELAKEKLGILRPLLTKLNSLEATKAASARTAKDLIITALFDSSNNDERLFNIASKTFELATGIELFCETDPENGENYDYKSQGHNCITSTRLHPEVSQWLGWRSQRGDSCRDDMKSLMEIAYCDETTNPQIAKYLADNWRLYSTQN